MQPLTACAPTTSADWTRTVSCDALAERDPAPYARPEVDEPAAVSEHSDEAGDPLGWGGASPRGAYAARAAHAARPNPADAGAREWGRENGVRRRG